MPTQAQHLITLQRIIHEVADDLVESSVFGELNDELLLDCNVRKLTNFAHKLRANS